MPKSDYDETWATARLPNVDVGILHRRAWDGGAEQLLVTVWAVPPAEVFSRLLEISNPLVVWTRMMEAAWAPWIGARTPALTESSRPPLALS
jgi:hypothetical protein